MNSIVTALYDSREEAGRALHALKAELSLVHAAIYDPTRDGFDALRLLDLTPDERAACEEKLASGDHLLLARVNGEREEERVIAVLERSAADPAPAPRWQPLPAETRASASGATANAAEVVTETRMPLMEEELRIGTREVVRGGVRVRTRVEEVPVSQEIELIEEFARVDKRPASRPISPEELEQAGLLRERVIEIAQVREEAVVTKQAFVREEVVVSKTTERRVAQIHETVCRMEVETEELGAGAGPRP